MVLPSLTTASLSEKFKAYESLITSLINQYKKDPFGADKIKAAYATANLAITGTCAAIASGAALSISESGASKTPGKNKGITSRKEALEITGKILEFYGLTIDFQSSKIEKNAFADATPVSHLALAELVYSSIQLIINTSFALPLQRTITLDRDRQAIELCAELYGSVDYLDEFIVQNNLNGNEIILLPMGKKVSYYVQSA